MKDLAIFSSKLIFLILASLGKPQQNICSCICLALAIINLKLITGKLLSPADLSRAQGLCIHETTKIVVICEDKYLMFATFQVVALCLKSYNNSQKLTVVDLVLCFCSNYFPQNKWYWMPLVQIGLSNYLIWPSFGN